MSAAASPVVPVGSEEALPPISLDGPHKIGEHRQWLARQLLDSRQDDAEAYSTVIYSPAMTDIWRDGVVPVGVRERVLDELDKAWLHGQRRTSWRRDEAADAILAALRPTDTGWRDIATAPRNGDDVLACDDETGERHVSYWTGHYWSGRTGFKPTHWMPLHPAPTDTGWEA
jgi:hypothetical protein